MVYNSEECLKWIKDNYDISFHDRFGIVDLVFEYVKLHEEERFKELEAEHKWKEKQKEKEETRADYEETTDEKGRVWYNRTHYSHQRPESRKLMEGDAIIFKTSLHGYEGDEDGLMIINSFDYESDFVARSYFAIENCRHVNKLDNTVTEWTSAHGGGAPGIDSFSYATDEEIANFFKKIKETMHKEYNFYFKSDFTPDIIKNRYHRFIND